jgi:hypothetical protein
MSRFIDWLRAAGLDEGRPIVGISATEIGQLAAAQGQTELPAVYREFLEDCGRGAGLFHRDVECFFPAMMDLKQELVEMLEEVGIDFTVPAAAFVFSAYQGFQYHYFICDGTADPAVYEITNGGKGVKLLEQSFSEYIRKGIEMTRAARIKAGLMKS